MKANVLDHGFVELIETMGNDTAIADAARNSYGKGTRAVSDDRQLIRYLLRHYHTTPFEMVEFKFHMRLPVFVARQMIRQRMANLNEYSGRYSVMQDLFYIPDPSRVGKQSATNKQGTGEPLSEREALEFCQSIADASSQMYGEYLHDIDPAGLDISRELARIRLPVNIYTEWTWKIDLHNLFNFLRQRLDNHAQWEIRQYAEAIAEMVRLHCPIAYEAFEDYRLHAVSFSQLEMIGMQWMLNGGKREDAEQVMLSIGATKREIAEFGAKLDA